MLVSKFIEIFSSLETESVIGGFDYIEVVQQTLDDIWSDDTFARLLQPPPDVVTIDTQLVYTFLELFPTYIDSNQKTTIRRIKGLYDPALNNPTNSSLFGNDNARRLPQFDQELFDQRIYDGQVHIDNERRTVTFETNPGDTTDSWKVDMFLKAPTVQETDEIPLLPGWERKLLMQGCRSWYDELDEGEPSKATALFEAMKVKYRDALLREYRKRDYRTDVGYRPSEPEVIPQ